MAKLDLIAWDARGLVPVVVQHADTGQVLMLAYANREAVALTLERGLAHFWSRSRQRLWCKGETSGHFLRVVEVRIDCDGDALLYRVHPDGPTCHTGQASCFHRLLTAEGISDDAELARGGGVSPPVVFPRTLRRQR